MTTFQSGGEMHRVHDEAHDAFHAYEEELEEVASGDLLDPCDSHSQTEAPEIDVIAGATMKVFHDFLAKKVGGKDALNDLIKNAEPAGDSKPCEQDSMLHLADKEQQKED